MFIISFLFVLYKSFGISLDLYHSVTFVKRKKRKTNESTKSNGLLKQYFGSDIQC